MFTIKYKFVILWWVSDWCYILYYIHYYSYIAILYSYGYTKQKSTQGINFEFESIDK